VELHNSQWKEQYEDLIDAYLWYSEHEQDGRVPDMVTEGGGAQFRVEVVDIFHRKVQMFVSASDATHANTTLI